MYLIGFISSQTKSCLAPLKLGMDNSNYPGIYFYSMSAVMYNPAPHPILGYFLGCWGSIGGCVMVYNYLVTGK